MPGHLQSQPVPGPAAMAAWGRLKPLTQGRVLVTTAALIFCFDSPMLKEMRYRLPDTDDKYGFAVSLWRSWSGCVTAVFCSYLTAGGWREYGAKVKGVGYRKFVLASLMQSVSASRFDCAPQPPHVLTATCLPRPPVNVCFTLAVTLTTAANVLVILACAPLSTALIGRLFKGTRLPRHTLAACVTASVSVALCFIGSLDVSGSKNLLGLVIALFVALAYGFVLTLAEDADLTVMVGASSGLSTIMCLCVLGSKIPGAWPVDFGRCLLALSNGSLNAVGNQLLALGCQTCPSAEAALITLLETALGPILVFLIVGEKPSAPTLAAGVIIIAVLICHTVYDARWQRLKQQAEAQAGGEEEALVGQELLPSKALKSEDAEHGSLLQLHQAAPAEEGLVALTEARVAL